MSSERLDAHMSHPSVQAAQRAWEEHVAGCAQCTAAPGPPPHRVEPSRRWYYACEVGVRLHDEMVRAAQEAYRSAHPEAFAPEPHDG